MKKIITLFSLFAIPFSGMSQENVCSKFKNGTFKVTDPETKKVCIIKRDGNTQTEKLEEAEDVYDFTINWVDDCTYTVTPTPVTVQKNKEILKLGTMTVKITPVSDSSYVQTVRVANSPKFKRKDEVFLVKE